MIPKGWLYYLPPEIMSTLKASYRQQKTELPYTKESDVYAFGFVLVCQSETSEINGMIALFTVQLF